MSKLYELTESMNVIYDLAEQEEYENIIDDLSKAMDEVEGEFDDKAVATACLIKSLELDLAGVKTEKTNFANRQSVLERRIRSIKDYLFENMVRAGKTKIQGTRAVLSIQNNPPRAEIDEVKFIEWAAKNREDLLRYREPEIEKKAVVDLLKQGEKIPFTELTQGKSLRIK